MILSWNVTRECNLKCLHCYRDAGAKDPDELSREEAFSLIDEIALAGFRILIFSGGEPLMRRDIFELIGHAREAGLRPVLGTNGVMIDAPMAGALKKAGLARAGVSLDSVREGIHDHFRQKPGAWRAALRAMAALLDAGLEFQVHTTVSARNREEIPALVDFAVSLGASAHHLFFLVPAGRGMSESGWIIDPRDYEALLKKILGMQKRVPLELKPVCAPQFMRLAEEMGMPTRFRRGCLAGISYCCVLPNGDVHPCPYLPLKVGNVRRTRFSDLWKGNEIFERMRGLEYSGGCGGCAHKRICGGCRARAFASSGDYMAEDGYCALNARG